MIFHKTPLDGARVIELEKRGDDRGFFARLFCEKEFAAEGLETRFVQINNSLSSKRGTLRGLHYQLPPSGEVKVVRAIRGALYDVIVDLRAGSPTFGKWFGAELSAENRMMMYVPRGLRTRSSRLPTIPKLFILSVTFMLLSANEGFDLTILLSVSSGPLSQLKCPKKTEHGPTLIRNSMELNLCGA